jgi:putative ABC transport system permease protein
MIIYYFKRALNNLWRNKQSALFNICGLSIGIACCILITLFIKDDLGYDNHNPNARNIFRLIAEFNENGSVKFWTGMPAPLKAVMKEEIPELNNVVRFDGVQEYTSLLYKNREFRDPKILLTDPEVFEVFNLRVIKGNPKTLLNELNSIVITKSFARKVFANDDPIGKVISLKGQPNSDFMVTGVIDTIPVKSSIQFNCICSFQLLNENRWGIWNYETFVSIRENTNLKNLELKFRTIEKKYLNTKDEIVRLGLQPLTKIHLDLNPLNRFPTEIDNKLIFIIALIGLLILLIACFNYVILSTTAASKRNMEVGIQKVFGASRQQLILQYLGESILIAIVATYFGVLLAENYLPVLNQLSGKHIAMDYGDSLFYVFLAISTFAIGIVSGLYPAVFLSAFKPTGIFKSEFYKGLTYKKNFFRESLILIQFVISILLIISTITIKKQLAFIRSKDLGLNYQDILVLSIHQKEVKEKLALFTDNILKNPKIIKVSATSYLPGNWGYRQSSWWEGMPPGDKSAMLDWMAVDTNFIKLLKIKLLSGSDFSSVSFSQEKYILNQAAVQSIGWKSPLGKSIDIIGKGEVIGVVGDFNFKSLHSRVDPLALCIYPKAIEYLYLKLQHENIASTIEHIQNEWETMFPGIEFNFSFLDNHIEGNYNSEIRSGKLMNYFAIIAIVLSCLGIFSFVSFSTLQRTREIGLRKVTGATTRDIMLMLSINFTKWVGIAFIIASPIAYLTMDKWLQKFAYRTQLSWWIFIFAGMLTLVVALLTMFWECWRVANKNPVEALRYE